MPARLRARLQVEASTGPNFMFRVLNAPVDQRWLQSLSPVGDLYLRTMYLSTIDRSVALPVASRLSRTD
jgi:hypothetical protein